MKILATKQHTAEWAQARLGKITASRIADVMSYLKQTKAEVENGTRRESAERRNYRMELLAERMTKISASHYVSPFMEFGSTSEDTARRAYEVRMQVMVEQLGFVQHPSLEYAGASPDGLVDLAGGVEVKAPKTETHIAYSKANIVPPEYEPQMMFGMACCEREWWDFVSFDPRMPERYQFFTKRLYWNEARAREIIGAVEQFNEELEAEIAALDDIFPPLEIDPDIADRGDAPDPLESAMFLTEEELNLLPK